MGDVVKTFIISGFLGAGKTELVSNIIKQHENKNILVIENEVAEIGIDGKISRGKNVTVIELNDGSITSVNLHNFEKVIKKGLIKFRPDILIIEASGAADLKPLLAVLKQFKQLEVYGITIIDVERFSQAQKLSTHTLQHVKHASSVLLNKCDLVNKKIINKQKMNLKHLNNNIHTCTKCNVNISKILQNANPIKLGGKKKSFMAPHLFWEIKKHWGLKSKQEKHKRIDAYVFETYGLIDINKLKQILTKNKIPRAKGFVYADEIKPYYFSIVNEHFEIEKAPKFDIKGRNKIIIIGNNIYSKRNHLRKELQKCVRKSFGESVQNFIMDNWAPRPKKIIYLEPIEA